MELVVDPTLEYFATVTIGAKNKILGDRLLDLFTRILKLTEKGLLTKEDKVNIQEFNNLSLLCKVMTTELHDNEFEEEAVFFWFYCNQATKKILVAQ